MNTAEARRLWEAYERACIAADASSRSQLELQGTDAVAFLHNFCTQDIKRLSSGEGGEAFFCTVQGKIVGYGYVFRLGDSILIETATDQAIALHDHLDRYLIREDVEITIRDEHWGLIACAGARAAQLLSETFDVTPPSEHEVASLELDNELELRRVPLYGTTSWHLRCPAARTAELMEALASGGAEMCDAEFLETLRIQAGSPEYGKDVSLDNLPQEVGRDSQCISFNKGCYLGQEPVARIDAMGHVNRHLLGLLCDSPSQPDPGTQVFVAGQPAGRVTSSAFSPRHDRAIALAYLRREHARTGEVVSWEGGSAVTQTLPFDSGR